MIEEYLILPKQIFPDWGGDHYECTSSEFSKTLPNKGFYFWFYFKREDQDVDAMYFMGNEL